MPLLTCVLCVAPLLLGLGVCVGQGDILPPEVFLQSHDEHSVVRYSNPIQLPDGTLVRYSIDGGSDQLSSHTSEDGGRTWGPLGPECGVLPQTYMVLPLLDRDGEMHLISMVGRGEGEIAVTRFIDVWHQRTDDRRATWREPSRIYEGYCGALLDFKQLSTGRLAVPFAWWVPKRPVAPPIGANLCTVFNSDDGGRTWLKSPSDLSSPCYPDFSGNNYGADEPCLIELEGGRLWMLMRTQTGFLYESFSTDQGHTWSEAEPSRFVSSSSPAMLSRMPDGRIVLLWNNCESAPPHEGVGVYVNRDALHMAISDDDGATWRGFREVYRDPLENETPPDTDRGTAYPTPPVYADGRIVFLTGQGVGRRNLVSVDPRWVTLTHHEDDFSHGLGGWIAFKPVGPAKNWRRARTPGPGLIDHPSKPGAKALRIRRPDDHAPDGALWNFPNGSSGTLTLRIMPAEGFGGCDIALTDRSFKPTDTNSSRLAVFALSVGPDGGFGAVPGLVPGRWNTLDLDWNLAERSCAVAVNGETILQLPQLNPTGNGISYLHLRSTAAGLDEAGFLIESASVDIHDPVAPKRTPDQNRALLERYLPSNYAPPAERHQAARRVLDLY